MMCLERGAKAATVALEPIGLNSVIGSTDSVQQKKSYVSKGGEERKKREGGGTDGRWESLG